MRIPKIITSNGNQFILVKEYPNFVMYKDMITGVKECFNKQDLGLIERQKKPRKLRPENVSYL